MQRYRLTQTCLLLVGIMAIISSCGGGQSATVTVIGPETQGADASEGDVDSNAATPDDGEESRDASTQPGDATPSPSSDTSAPGGDVDGGGDAPDSAVGPPQGPAPTSCEGLSNGAPCEDGDACTSGDSCFIGVCEPGEMKVCDGQGTCRIGVCIPETAACSYTDAPAGQSCPNEDPCALESQCSEGLCSLAVPINCEDDNACTNDACAAGECINEPIDDGAACEVLCFGASSCADGVCVPDPETEVNCAPVEDEPCLSGFECDVMTGLCSTPIPVPEETFCETDDTICTKQMCDGEGSCIVWLTDTCVTQNNLDPCWEYVCDPIEGCQQQTWTPDPPCPGPICGDGFCLGDENCFTCETDCGACCGDGICEPSHAETCFSCEADCGVCCGNGACDFGEDCLNCDQDCGTCCGDGACTPEHLESCLNCPTDCGECCGNGVCDADVGETCTSCEGDCGQCCGNGSCDFGEDCLSCAEDCGQCCSSGSCDVENGDTCQTCPQFCGTCCGNGSCDAAFNETCSTCEEDCGACCGDGSCDPEVGETCGFCPEDCGSCCGNGLCDPGESCESCGEDCGLCACGNGTCCGDETCESCPMDCGDCSSPESALKACEAGAPSGVSRDCGWTLAGGHPCTPESVVTIACHGEGNCNLGYCTGDAMLRICDGISTGCKASDAIAQSNDACGTTCPYLSFLCPSSGYVSVLKAPKDVSGQATCQWVAYPTTPDASSPCDQSTCGANRECGWTKGAVTQCSPGVTLEVGCAGPSCGPGQYTGNPMIRVCSGEDAICSADEALAQNDDAVGCSSEGASVTITCPTAGVITTLVAPHCVDEPDFSCDICVSCPSCSPPW